MLEISDLFSITGSSISVSEFSLLLHYEVTTCSVFRGSCGLFKYMKAITTAPIKIKPVVVFLSIHKI